MAINRDYLTFMVFVIAWVMVSVIAGGCGFIVGKLIYGNQVYVQVVEHNNTIYRNISVEKECNTTVIIKEIMVEPPTTTTITTSTTTTTLVHHISSAGMFNLYNRNQTETHNEKCILNYTVTYNLRWWSGYEVKFEPFDCYMVSDYIFGEVDDWTHTKGADRKVLDAYVNWTNGTFERVYP